MVNLLRFLSFERRKSTPAGRVPPNAVLLPGSKSKQKCLLLRRACSLPSVCGVYKLRWVRFTTVYSAGPGPIERPLLLYCSIFVVAARVSSLHQLPASTQFVLQVSLATSPCDAASCHSVSQRFVKLLKLIENIFFLCWYAVCNRNHTNEATPLI